jgi:hypothetical protein
MTDPNVNLQSILELKLSNNASSPTEGADHYFYLRSWVFTLDELETFLGYRTEEDSIIEEIMRWNDVVAQQRRSSTGTDLLTIRYVGICQGPKRPIDPFNEDVHSRRSGTFIEFVRVMEMLIPHGH